MNGPQGKDGKIDGWWSREKIDRMGAGKNRMEVVQALRRGEMTLEQGIMQGFAGEGDPAIALADALEIFDTSLKGCKSNIEERHQQRCDVVANALAVINAPHQQPKRWWQM